MTTTPHVFDLDEFVMILNHTKEYGVELFDDIYDFDNFVLNLIYLMEHNFAEVLNKTQKIQLATWLINNDFDLDQYNAYNKFEEHRDIIFKEIGIDLFKSMIPDESYVIK